MRELHEVAKTQKKSGLVEYSSKTRSLLKRVKKVVSWARAYSPCISKQKELDSYISTRLQNENDIANFLFSLHSQQKFSLRTPSFAISEAADILCRGEYYGFPNIGYSSSTNKKKISLEKFTRVLRHKALLIEHPIGAQIMWVSK